LFYIIFTGSVDVIVSSKDFRGNAQQTKLINLTEGSHFGELALMKGHGIRSATVMTREECRFLIICERDYNATLRRMQKEDLAKRVGVLDKISIFQTPEWTGELLKEMSYVLSEQKLPASSVLFKQGDKALQVFFVVRGELVMTKEIVNPVTHVTQLAVVERVGRYRVVGDDAYVGQFGVRLRVHFPPKHTNQSRLCLCA
jgi:CRP-like cAMP-binding protein